MWQINWLGMNMIPLKWGQMICTIWWLPVASLHSYIWYFLIWYLHCTDSSNTSVTISCFTLPPSGRSSVCIQACRLSLWTAGCVSFTLRCSVLLTRPHRECDRDANKLPSNTHIQISFFFPFSVCLCVPHYYTSKDSVIVSPLKDSTLQPLSCVVLLQNKHQNEQRKSDNKTQGERQNKIVTWL